MNELARELAAGLEHMGISLPESAQSRDEMLRALKASGAKLACLCSSDKVYASEGASAAAALKEAGATQIYLAGQPGDLEAQLKSAGVTDFVSAGADAIAVLRGAYANLEL